MTSPNGARFAFPHIRRVQLHAFSLYSLEPDIAIAFGSGVTCLAGANGIGKSTFLSTVNYGLTGAVPHPRRRFLSADAYFKEAQDFTKGFFDGRIAEGDRDVAAVTIEFSIGQKVYSLTRGLFDLDGLRALVIADGQAQVGELSQTNLQRESQFRSAVCADIGLSSFEQYVFLQHFLLTFDESRHLLFWDKAASEQVLYLCFGGNPSEAAQADQLNREMEKAGSWGRNLQFQVNNLNKRIDILEQSLGLSQGTSADLERETAQYRALLDSLSKTTEASEHSDANLNEADLRVTQAAAAVGTYRAAYASAFERLLHGNGSVQTHPTIESGLATSICPICHTSHERVAATIKTRLDARSCPLCESPFTVSSEPNPALQKELVDADAKLADARKRMEEATQTRDRKEKETRAARDAVQMARTALMLFEEANQKSLDIIKGQAAALDGPVAQNLASLRDAKTQLIAQRDSSYSDRDKHKESLKHLQRQLEQRYALAERTFVPRFRALAELFLGIDLDVSFAASQSTGVNLELELRGDARREQHQLSESQRFFVDIALRMALVQHVSIKAGEACLFVDTPEGSLDIAYEDRAGEMFADFVKSGHSMLMTANINSSKLLTTLAQKCGPHLMTIIQMTGWTELSDVQQRAGDLFRSAYNDLTKALNSGESN